MNFLNRMLALFALVLSGAGLGMYIYANHTCGGPLCIGAGGTALALCAAGLVLSVFAWLLGLVRWVFGGPSSATVGILPFAPLLPIGIFLAIELEPKASFVTSNGTLVVGALLAALLLTPLLALLYSFARQPGAAWG